MGSLKFGTDDLSTEIRHPFVGDIVSAVYPCECDSCKAGDEKLVDTGGKIRDRLHLEIQVLDGSYEKNQHEWLTPSNTIYSKWGAFNQALEELGVLPESASDLEGKAYEWTSKDIPVGIGNKTAIVWIPTRVVEGAELKKYQEIAAKR